MNREQKRSQFKAARGNEDALWCPNCKHKTFHSAIKVAGDVDHYDIYCGVCTKFMTRLKLEEQEVAKNRLRGHMLTDIQKKLVERTLI